MATAGGRSNTNFAANKGINVQGERQSKRAAAENANHTSGAVSDEALIERVR